MITELNSSYYIGSNYLKAAELCGLATDTKPTNVGNGSTLHEIDTGKKYMFDASGKEWYEQTSEGGGGSGSNTLVVTYTLGDAPGEATCDYTLAEIKDHLDNGGQVVAKIPASNKYVLLPLYQAYNDNDDLIFSAFGDVQTRDDGIYIYYSYVYHYYDGDDEVIEAYYNAHVVVAPAT